MSYLDELRASDPEIFGNVSDAEFVRVAAEMSGRPQTNIARDFGLDPSDYATNKGVLGDSGAYLVLVAMLALAVIGFSVVKFREKMMSLLARLQDLFAELPAPKKAVGVGAVVFLLACLFPPIQSTPFYGGSRREGPSSFEGFGFLFNLPSNGLDQYAIAGMVLGIELMAIVVMTGVAAYLLRED